MKEVKQKSPISLLLIFCDKGRGYEVEEYLNKHHLKGGLMIMGKGTAESDVADIFGFGMCDRDIIACIIPSEKQDKILEDVTKITGVEEDSYGLTMLLDIASASSTMLEHIGFKGV